MYRTEGNTTRETRRWGYDLDGLVSCWIKPAGKVSFRSSSVDEGKKIRSFPSLVELVVPLQSTTLPRANLQRFPQPN